MLLDKFSHIAWRFLTRCKAGMRMPMSSAIMAITTSSSIKVNPLRELQLKLEKLQRETSEQRAIPSTTGASVKTATTE